jgi:hypothetical protein
MAHDSSITSWASTNRRRGPPGRNRATLIPIGMYRALSKSAAPIAAMGWPAAAITAAAANWADPAKVTALMAIAGMAPIPPADTDRTPNDTPKSPTAIAKGTAVVAPGLSLNGIRDSLVTFGSL